MRLCKESFYTQEVKQLLADLTVTAPPKNLDKVSLEVILGWRHPPSSEAFNIFFYSLLLVKFDEGAPNGLKIITKLKDIMTLFHLSPANKDLFRSVFDSLLVNEILAANEEDQIIDWAFEAASLKKETGQKPTALSAAFNKISQHIWRKVSALASAPTDKGYRSLLELVNKCKACDLQVQSVGKIIVGNIISFIQARNQLYNMPSELPKNIQEDYRTIDFIRGVGIIGPDDEEFRQLEELEKELGEKEPKNTVERYEESIIQNAPREDIERIDFSDIDMEENSIYPKNTRHVQVRVYKGKRKSTNQAVALKMYKILTEGYMEMIEQEIRIYQILGKIANYSNCFLQYHGTIYPEVNTVYLVMEYIEKNLIHDIERRKKVENGMYTEETIIQIFRLLLKSFADMQAIGIYHGDIKPQNILIDSYDNPKIIDFDVAQLITDDSEQEISNRITGTDGYYAPELVLKLRAGEKSSTDSRSKTDVFSLGLVFLQLLTLELTGDLNEPQNNEALMEIVENRVRFDWAKNLLRMMLALEPTNRREFKDLLTYIENTKTVLMTSSGYSHRQ